MLKNMRYYFLVGFLNWIQIAVAFTKQEKIEEYALVTCAQDCGMFRTMASVIGLLKLYEEGRYVGLEVDFGTQGLYYDSSYGTNWWGYYFEPLAVGNLENALIISTVNGPSDVDCAMLCEFELYKRKVNKLIKKYIIIKPYIQEKVDAFVSKFFTGHQIIGVHYRGTDKWDEAPREEFEIILNHIFDVSNKLKQNNPLIEDDDIKVFIATDENKFLNFMKRKIPSKILFDENIMRSYTLSPVHKIDGFGYKKGEDALIDCLILARCHTLIKTSSNLSLFSTYFNPEMPVIHATIRHWRAPLE